MCGGRPPGLSSWLLHFTLALPLTDYMAIGKFELLSTRVSLPVSVDRTHLTELL